MELLSAIRHRRSYYNLSNATLPDNSALGELIQAALKYTPSAFNMQSSRACLVLGDTHRLLWDGLADILKPLTTPEKFQQTRAKTDSFKAAYGTVLFFDDTDVVQNYITQYPLYAAHFKTWAEQSNGMLQNNVWMLLEAEGLGANLQHYNPLIDPLVYRLTQVPTNWHLIAQMPFGLPESVPETKTFVPLADRFKQIGG